MIEYQTTVKVQMTDMYFISGNVKFGLHVKKLCFYLNSKMSDAWSSEVVPRLV